MVDLDPKITIKFKVIYPNIQTYLRKNFKTNVISKNFKLFCNIILKSERTSFSIQGEMETLSRQRFFRSFVVF